MKTKPAIVLIVACALAVVHAPAEAADESFAVHEWGTFTSFQGGDGKLLPWRPLQTSQLPPFVYNWRRAGLDRRSANPMIAFGKGGITSLQRMETPVVYFYSDKEMAVDLTVGFPKGLITEWFPQASLIGPSAPMPAAPAPSQPAPSVQNNLSCGPVVAPGARMTPAAAPLSDTQTPKSLVQWSHLEIMPPRSNAELLKALPAETSGSHYFAARETDSDFVRGCANLKTNGLPEYEKFLFYRGTGDFETPLRVTMTADDTVVLANTGKEPLSHLFVLGVRDKSGKFVYVDELAPGKQKSVPLNLQQDLLPGGELSKSIGVKLARALEKSGLYPREASAMVKTWSDSWFAENGVRVLYVLPRDWTDSTLPMTLNPAPRQLVRVMVGRAEVLPPGVEQSLALQIGKARQGDAGASAETRKLLRNLGRFAEPAFYRVLAEVKPQAAEQGRLMMLLIASQGPE